MGEQTETVEKTEQQLEAEADAYVDKLVRGELGDDAPIVDDSKPADETDDDGEEQGQDESTEETTEQATETDETTDETTEELSDEELATETDSRPDITDQHERKAERLKLSGIVKQAKRYRDGGDRSHKAAEQLLAQAKEEREASKRAHAFVDDLVAKIRSGQVRDVIATLSKQAGHDPADVMQMAVEEAAGGGGEKRIQMQIAQLSKELEDERAARKKEAEERQAWMAQAHTEQIVAGDVRKFIGIRDNPAAVKLYPALARMPADLLEETVRPFLVDGKRMHDEFGGSLDNLAAHLDKRYRFVLPSDSSGSESSGAGENSTGQGPRQRKAAKPGGSKQAAPNLTNRDAAEDNGSRREMTPEEHEAEAARLERELVDGFYSED